MSDLAVETTKTFIRVGDIQLHTVFAGPEDGEPLLFLHGFPEFWYGWRHQIEYFAREGYRVIVPDQRGYNLSDKPADASAYDLNTLAEDIRHLMDALDYEQVTLIGHDWGGAVAWWFATLFPERLSKLALLNIPYPSVMSDQYKAGDIGQMLKSWYIGFFQIPVVPEALVSLNDYAVIVRMMRSSSNLGSFTDADMEEYKIAWGQPNAFKSMLHWYRAMAQHMPRGSENPYHERIKANIPIKVPTLLLWGEQDVALKKELAQPSIDLVQDGELIFFPDATHWLQHDKPDAVNQLIHDFVQRDTAEPISESDTTSSDE